MGTSSLARRSNLGSQSTNPSLNEIPRTPSLDLTSKRIPRNSFSTHTSDSTSPTTSDASTTTSTKTTSTKTKSSGTGPTQSSSGPSSSTSLYDKLRFLIRRDDGALCEVSFNSAGADAKSNQIAAAQASSPTSLTYSTPASAAAASHGISVAGSGSSSASLSAQPGLGVATGTPVPVTVPAACASGSSASARRGSSSASVRYSPPLSPPSPLSSSGSAEHSKPALHQNIKLQPGPLTPPKESLSLSMLRRTHSSVPTFEIRLDHSNLGRDHNIVLLQGPPEEASSARLSGRLLLSATDNMGLKKLYLRLTATLRLRWSDAAHQHKNPQHAPLRYERTLFEREFSQFDLPTKASRSNPASKGATPAASFTNLASYFQQGHSSGDNGTSTPSTPSQSIAAGAYDLPFEFVIPGDSPESIEGHDNVQVAYFLTAHVERGRFQHNLSTKRHVRVVRTLGVDTYDYAHTVSIDNTWPGKVEYNIHVPSKSVPIGGKLEVQFRLLPLSKGLKLGRIRTEIVQYTSLVTAVGTQFNNEKVVAQQSFSSSDIQRTPEDDGWVFTRVVDLPTSLSQCTQDSSLDPYVKITHKFRAFISLLNRDGHTSELRASLPINLYISPQVYVSSATVTSSQSGGMRVAGTEAPIFDVERTSPAADTNDPTSRDELTRAPPNYTNHVYDLLWSNVGTPLESPGSPIASGSQTPLPLLNGSPSHRSLADLDSRQRAELVAGLRALQQAQQAPSGAVAGTSTSNAHAPIYRYSNNSSHSSSAVDIQALSRVPSYDRAVNEGASQDPAPEYQD